jgi:hypothetical protein
MSLVILTDSKGTPFDAHALRVEMDLRGAWTAHLETTAEEDIDGDVTITIQHGDEVAAVFVGTVDDGAPYEGRAPLVVVGGAGGLGKRPMKGAYYVAAPSAVEVEKLVHDIATEADEVCPPLGLIGYRASAWSRLDTESHARALSRIADRFDLGWRILDTGSLWVGVETWPVAALEGQELDVDTDARIVRITYRVASARPGTTIDGRRISRVVFTDDGRGELHYEAGA